MIFSGSSLRVVDNSGAKQVNCIRVVKKICGTIGDHCVGSVRRYRPDKPLRKGDVIRGLVVQVKKNKERYDGTFCDFFFNSLILLKKTDLLVPQGTRILGCLGFEIRFVGYGKIVTMAKWSA